MNLRSSSKPTARKGFTLVELMIVILVIAILAAISINGMGYATKNAARKKTTAQMAAMELVLTRYHNDYGSYPSGADFTGLATGGAFDPAFDGSQLLYRVISGDYNGDGDVEDAGEEPVFEATQGSEGKFGLVREEPAGTFGIVDGFQNPLNYRSAIDANAGGGNNCFNTYTYDLWSYADDDNPPSTAPTPGGTDGPKWITNW